MPRYDPGLVPTAESIGKRSKKAQRAYDEYLTVHAQVTYSTKMLEEPNLSAEVRLGILQHLAHLHELLLKIGEKIPVPKPRVKKSYIKPWKTLVRKRDPVTGRVITRQPH